MGRKFGGAVTTFEKLHMLFDTSRQAPCISAHLLWRDLGRESTQLSGEHRVTTCSSLQELTEGGGGKSFAKPADEGQCGYLIGSWFLKRSYVNVQKHSDHRCYRNILPSICSGNETVSFHTLHRLLSRLCWHSLGTQPGRGLWSDRHRKISGNSGC